MFAVYRKEMRSYLTSPVGWVYLTVFYAISGYYFFATSLVGNLATLSYVFSSLFTISIFMVPMLTMRLLSEERRHRTEQALFTAPVSFTSITLGKFLACLTMYALGVAVTGAFLGVLAAYGNPDLPVFLCNLIGMMLLGAALCAIGLFLSAQTENQVIAVVSGLGAGLFLLLIDSFTSISDNATLNAVLEGVSFYARYTGFASGLLNLADVFFFLSVTGLFLFLTVRTLNRRRLA